MKIKFNDHDGVSTSRVAWQGMHRALKGKIFEVELQSDGTYLLPDGCRISPEWCTTSLTPMEILSSEIPETNVLDARRDLHAILDEYDSIIESYLESPEKTYFMAKRAEIVADLEMLKGSRDQRNHVGKVSHEFSNSVTLK